MFRDIRGFMFDLDGTLVRRGDDERLELLPSAADVIAAIRSSGRPLVVFTNASHVPPARIARDVSEAGIDLAEEEVLTPICSCITYLRRYHAGASVRLVGTTAARDQLQASGIDLVDDPSEAQIVFVAHVERIDISEIEATARAVMEGAGFLTANYARAYAGATGPILSRGAMVTAAIAKGAGRRARIVGKPSRAAMAEVSRSLGVSSSDTAVIGDDLDMDVALGLLGDSRTVLVATGISGAAATLRPRSSARRADLVVRSLGELLPLL